MVLSSKNKIIVYILHGKSKLSKEHKMLKFHKKDEMRENDTITSQIQRITRL